MEDRWIRSGTHKVACQYLNHPILLEFTCLYTTSLLITSTDASEMDVIAHPIRPQQPIYSYGSNSRLILSSSSIRKARVFPIGSKSKRNSVISCHSYNTDKTKTKESLKHSEIKLGMSSPDMEIDGVVLLMKVRPIDPLSTIEDELRKRVEIKLISSDHIDKESGIGKSQGESSYIEWNALKEDHLDRFFKIKFKWNSILGLPGAFLIVNNHPSEFFLRFLKIDIPGHGELLFTCNSWIYPAKNDKNERIFFSNKSYLPRDTPTGLIKLRERDLKELRGNGGGERKLADRVYDYDVYNDIGDPDKSLDMKRQVLGGSKEFPYPRRCRTGRPPAKNDPRYESRGIYPLYIPPDERFPYEDFVDFGATTIMSFAITVKPRILLGTKKDFGSFDEIDEFYDTDYKLPSESFQSNPIGAIKRFFQTGSPLNLERPQITLVNQLGWKTDIEFARQTLAGANPMVIECLKEFPPTSKLDTRKYGPGKSTIDSTHIDKLLQNMSTDEALKGKKLFMLDYYDVFMPYVEKINKLSEDSNKIYATRTLFYLNEAGILHPLAIELCLPPMHGKDAFRQVFTPNEEGTEEGDLWLLAKAHARCNDAGYHQLVSHWLRTHAVVEPFIIATHRHLSRMHPIYKLLIPHYLNTMDINQAAREFLINAGGIIEEGFTPGKYCMELSSMAYKKWKFTEQGLPADLLKRGMAVKDEQAPNGLRLVIDDYPYAVDGLELWSILSRWVSEYTGIYYKTDETVKEDKELQAWWNEVVTVGHGDLKDDPTTFHHMNSKHNLIDACTTLIWSASAHHAAVNFGQYAYGGYMPNLPTMTRKLIPEKGSDEYKEMMVNVDSYLLKTLSAPNEALLVTAVLHILASHAEHEVYIGQAQGSTPDWVDDEKVRDAFERFNSELSGMEKRVTARNEDKRFHNRRGVVDVPYTLLFPNTTDLSRKGGITGKGVPNSVSI